jgi:hypothetical protein
MAAHGEGGALLALTVPMIVVKPEIIHRFALVVVPTSIELWRLCIFHGSNAVGRKRPPYGVEAPEDTWMDMPVVVVQVWA